LLLFLLFNNVRYESRVCPGADGGVSIFTIDITSRKKSENRLAVLAQVGRLLATSVESHLPSLLASMLDIVGGTLYNRGLCGLWTTNKRAASDGWTTAQVRW
jgi:hypothetical protein